MITRVINNCQQVKIFVQNSDFCDLISHLVSSNLFDTGQRPNQCQKELTSPKKESAQKPTVLENV